MKKVFNLLQQKNQVVLSGNKISRMLIHINEKPETIRIYAEIKTDKEIQCTDNARKINLK